MNISKLPQKKYWKPFLTLLFLLGLHSDRIPLIVRKLLNPVFSNYCRVAWNFDTAVYCFENAEYEIIGNKSKRSLGYDINKR